MGAFEGTIDRVTLMSSCEDIGYEKLVTMGDKSFQLRKPSQQLK